MSNYSDFQKNFNTMFTLNLGQEKKSKYFRPCIMTLLTIFLIDY